MKIDTNVLLDAVRLVCKRNGIEKEIIENHMSELIERLKDSFESPEGKISLVIVAVSFLELILNMPTNEKKLATAFDEEDDD